MRSLGSLHTRRSEHLQRNPYCAANPKLQNLLMGLTGRILLADDNQAIRKLVCQLFDKHAFLEIRYEAADGQQAVEETKKHRPDLVILDLSMPVMDGLQAAKAIRKLFPNIPIILFTLYADVIQTSDTSGFTRIIPKAKMEVLVSQAEELVNFGQPRVVP